MKKTAAVILNRNLPELTDELAEWMLERHANEIELFVVENGSDRDKYSRYANITFTESLGSARGMNKALKQLLEKGYEYFWLNFNDARYRQPGFLTAAIEAIERDQRIGIFTGYWEDNVKVYGQLQEHDVLSIFETLGFLVTRKALLALAKWPRVPLDPLWDSSNYTGHYNTLATTLALYESGFYVASNSRFSIYEKVEEAAVESELARGYSDEEWKYVKGPADMQAWLKRSFPEISGTPKEVRAKILHSIERVIARQFPEIKPNYDSGKLKQRLKSVIKRIGV